MPPPTTNTRIKPKASLPPLALVSEPRTEIGLALDVLVSGSVEFVPLELLMGEIATLLDVLD